MQDERLELCRSAIRQVAAALADDEADAAALDRAMVLHLLGDERGKAVSLRKAGEVAGVSKSRLDRLKPRFERAIRAAFPVRKAA